MAELGYELAATSCGWWEVRGAGYPWEALEPLGVSELHGSCL